MVVPLFSLRDAHDIGSGEILDLIPFIDWLDRWHQRVVQLLPINEVGPGDTSPYTTISAFAIDPAYISTARVADIERSVKAQAWLSSSRVRLQMRRWRQSPVRERRSVYAFKLRLMELGFAELATLSPSDDRLHRFQAYCQRYNWWLDDYSLFRALKERRRWHSWESWPLVLRHRDAAALERAGDRLETRIRFYKYLQWIAAEQWEEVRAHARRRGVLLKGDLPFVCGRDSADVWAHQDLFDLSSSAGAPPDAFSATGQDWGLPLYDWAAMRRSGYEWWRQRARHARHLYDLFRVDHLVGLYRTYAIPVREGGTSGFVPPDEADQLVQGRAVLSAILEETGSGTGVMAEDLGSVPKWVRESLTALSIPGYKVMRWEKDNNGYIDPRSYPALSVATTGTHDTDTLVEWWQGLAGAERAAVATSLQLPNVEANPDLSWNPDLHRALLRRMYEAGSLMTILPIQDLFGWRDRINVPATIDEGNWSFRLPFETGELDRAAAIREQMESLRAMIDHSDRNHTQ